MTGSTASARLPIQSKTYFPLAYLLIKTEYSIADRLQEKTEVILAADPAYRCYMIIKVVLLPVYSGSERLFPSARSINSAAVESAAAPVSDAIVSPIPCACVVRFSVRSFADHLLKQLRCIGMPHPVSFRVSETGCYHHFFFLFLTSTTTRTVMPVRTTTAMIAMIR